MASTVTIPISVALADPGPDSPGVVLCNPQFTYSSTEEGVVDSGTTPNGLEYTLINLPQTRKGDQVLIQLSLLSDLVFASSPVQWVKLDIENPKPLEPVPMPEAVAAVTRLSDRRCQIDVLNPGEAAAYRFMLVLFWMGKVAISDPTLINPPPEHTDPG